MPWIDGGCLADVGTTDATALPTSPQIDMVDHSDWFVFVPLGEEREVCGRRVDGNCNATNSDKPARAAGAASGG